MRSLIVCSFVCLALACSSNNDDGQNGAVDVGGSTSVGGSSSTGGSSASPKATGGSSTAGETSTIAGATSTAGGSTSEVAGATSIGGSSSTATGGVTSAAGSSATNADASTSTGIPACATSAASYGALMCPTTLKLFSVALAARSVTFYAGCGPNEGAAPNGWEAICTDVLCAADGTCMCETTIPKGYYIQANGDVENGPWAIGNGNGGIVTNGSFSINGVLLTVDNAVKNAPGSGYNYVFKIDC
jgi:hypothetical protein